MADESTNSPWMTAAQAAEYLKRGRRTVLREIKAGRLRGAIVGRRGEVLTRAEWCDSWVLDQETPVALPQATATQRWRKQG